MKSSLFQILDLFFWATNLDGKFRASLGCSLKFEPSDFYLLRHSEAHSPQWLHTTSFRLTCAIFSCLSVGEHRCFSTWQSMQPGAACKCSSFVNDTKWKSIRSSFQKDSNLRPWSEYQWSMYHRVLTTFLFYLSLALFCIAIRYVSNYDDLFQVLSNIHMFPQDLVPHLLIVDDFFTVFQHADLYVDNWVEEFQACFLKLTAFHWFLHEHHHLPVFSRTQNSFIIRDERELSRRLSGSLSLIDSAADFCQEFHSCVRLWEPRCWLFHWVRLFLFLVFGRRRRQTARDGKEEVSRSAMDSNMQGVVEPNLQFSGLVVSGQITADLLPKLRKLDAIIRRWLPLIFYIQRIPAAGTRCVVHVLMWECPQKFNRFSVLLLLCWSDPVHHAESPSIFRLFAIDDLNRLGTVDASESVANGSFVFATSAKHLELREILLNWWDQSLSERTEEWMTRNGVYDDEWKELDGSRVRWQISDGIRNGEDFLSLLATIRKNQNEKID